MADQCIACGHVFLEVEEARYYGEWCAIKQTHSDPAEWETTGPWCSDCWQTPERDEAYERAAARYDGEGKDWR